MIRSFFIGTTLLCASAVGGVTLSAVHSSGSTVQVASIGPAVVETSSGFVIPSLPSLSSNAGTTVSSARMQPLQASARIILVEPTDSIPNIETLDRIPPAQEKLLAPSVQKAVVKARPLPAKAVRRSSRAPIAKSFAAPAAAQKSHIIQLTPVQPRQPALTSDVKKQVRKLALSPEYLIGVYR